MNMKLELSEDMILVSKVELLSMLTKIIEDMEFRKKDEILTIKETAELLKVSVPTVRKLIEINVIPYFQHNQIIRLKKSEVMNWVKTNKNL